MAVKTGDVARATDFTGMVFPYAGSSAPDGFLLCDGAAVSRTTYADLFGCIGEMYGAGDGSTTFCVPDLRGRMIIGAGTGTSSVTFNANSDVNTSTEQITVPSNQWLITGQAVVLAGSTLPTGLSAGTYYVIRIDATHIKLATTLANAQNGTPVNIAAAGSGNATITQTLTARALGDFGGEETHAMNSTELLLHHHALNGNSGSGSGNPGISGASGNSANTNDAGGNTAMPIMNPFAVINFIIKT